MKLNQLVPHRKFSTLIMLLVMLCGCQTTAPLYNAKNISISPRLSASNEEIAEAIWSAARRQGWKTERVGDRKIKAVKHIRSHSLTVSINYSKSSFDIIYIDSNNLKFDGSNIHKNYNIWIHQLEESIQNEIKFRLPEPRRLSENRNRREGKLF